MSEKSSDWHDKSPSDRAGIKAARAALIWAGLITGGIAYLADGLSIGWLIGIPIITFFVMYGSYYKDYLKDETADAAYHERVRNE